MARSKRRSRPNKPVVSRPPRQPPAQPRGEIVGYSESYSGPIPSAAELERYRQVDPRAVPTILDNFDEQSRHRRGLEATIITGSERRADRGQLFVAGLLATAVLGGLGAIFTGHDWAGATVAGAAIGSGALIYVVGGRPPKDDGSQ